jgi:N-acetylmuramoyl-L-alanine amidase
LNFALVAAFVITLFSAGVWLGMQVRAHDSRIPFLSSNPARAASDGRGAAGTTASANGRADSSINTLDAPLAPSSEANLAALPKITGIRHWSSPAGSTVVIDMEDQANYEVHRLMSPERIYFDLHDTNLPTDLEGKTIDVGDASLTRVRIAQPVAGVTRVVLDTKDGSIPKTDRISPSAWKPARIASWSNCATLPTRPLPIANRPPPPPPRPQLLLRFPRQRRRLPLRFPRTLANSALCWMPDMEAGT